MGRTPRLRHRPHRDRSPLIYRAISPRWICPTLAPLPSPKSTQVSLARFRGRLHRLGNDCCRLFNGSLMPARIWSLTQAQAGLLRYITIRRSLSVCVLFVIAKLMCYNPYFSLSPSLIELSAILVLIGSIALATIKISRVREQIKWYREGKCIECGESNFIAPSGAPAIYGEYVATDPHIVCPECGLRSPPGRSCLACGFSLRGLSAIDGGALQKWFCRRCSSYFYR